MKKNKEKKQEKKSKNEDLESLKEVKDENVDPNMHKENEDVLHEEVQTEEEKLKEEIKDLKEEKIRVLAEMENLRKRFDREKIDSIRFANVNFARDILLPGDNLERALSAINKEEEHSESIKNLIDGLLMVKKELSSSLEKNGIKKIETLNKKFDPNLHQAMMEIENDDLDEGIVVQEIQIGYTMYDRLLRPAMVGVSKKSKKDEEEVEPNIGDKLENADNKNDPEN